MKPIHNGSRSPNLSRRPSEAKGSPQKMIVSHTRNFATQIKSQKASTLDWERENTLQSRGKRSIISSTRSPQKLRKSTHNEQLAKDIRRVLKTIQQKTQNQSPAKERRDQLKGNIQRILSIAKSKEELEAVVGLLPMLLLHNQKTATESDESKIKEFISRSEQRMSEIRQRNQHLRQIREKITNPQQVALVPALFPTAPPRLYPLKKGPSNKQGTFEQLSTINYLSQGMQGGKLPPAFIKNNELIQRAKDLPNSYYPGLNTARTPNTGSVAESKEQLVSPYALFLEQNQLHQEHFRPKRELISITGTTLGGSSVMKVEFPKKFVPVLQQQNVEGLRKASPPRRLPSNFVKSSTAEGSPPRRKYQVKDQAEQALKQLAQHTVCVSGSSALVKINPKKAKVKILHPDYKLHYKHDINEFSRLMNVFIFATFRFKGSKMNLPLIYRVARQLGLGSLPSRYHLDEKKFKDKEFALSIKEKLLQLMHKKINGLNGIKKKPEPSRFLLKFSITPGNNHFLIRSVMKSRWWWSASDREGAEDVHFKWSPWKNKRFLNWLPSHQQSLKLEKQQEEAEALRIQEEKERLVKSRQRGLSSQNESPERPKEAEEVMKRSLANKRMSTSPTRASTSSSIQRSFPVEQAKYKIEPLDEEESVVSQGSESEDGEYTEQGTKKRDLRAYRIPHMRVHNKLEGNYHLGHKIALFLNLRAYYNMMGENVFNTVPVTYSLDRGGLSDPEFEKFKKHYNAISREIERLQMMKKKHELDKTQTSRRQSTLNSGACSEEESEDNTKGSPKKKSKFKSTRYNSPEDSEEEEDSGEAQFVVDDKSGKKTYIPKNIWIIKPGELSNCGRNIMVAQDFNDIKSCILESYDNSNAERPTVIVQKYIERPLLVFRRKFDIRVYAMLTSINGRLKGYYYEDGYIRTSSFYYTMRNLSNKYIHLTNDAIQKHGEEYGRFETGNKLSYNEMQRFFQQNHPHVHFFRDILPQIKKLITDTFRAVWKKIDPTRKHHGFEIYGYDFMIDQNFKVLLIECNTNPDLSFAAPLVARIVSNLIDNAFRLVVDPLFPPPEINRKAMFSQDPVTENRFTLIFDDEIDGPMLESIKLGKPSEDVISKKKSNSIVNVQDDETVGQELRKEEKKEKNQDELEKLKVKDLAKETEEETPNIEGIDIDGEELAETMVSVNPFERRSSQQSMAT